MGKKHINEISFLRSIACLSIVLLHSIAWGMEYVGFLLNLPELSKTILDSINVLLYYGTPTFIFITAFILGYSYKDKMTLSKGFLSKRLQFILIPYICMAFLYASPYALLSFEQFSLKVLLNIFIGDFHAYFVLIIFQFYLLFVFLKKWLDQTHPSKVILYSFLINSAYLVIFNFTKPVDIVFSDYVWERFYWIPFPGWIFYFSIAYYIGRNYESFIQSIYKYKVIVLIAPFVTGLALLYFYHSGMITIHSSKRIDILFHTLSVIAFVIYFARKMKSIPSLFLVINKYSYGIYLLHTSYISILIVLFTLLSLNMGIFTIIVLFVVSTACSIMTIYYVNHMRIGKYIVGKVDVKPKQIHQVDSNTVLANNQHSTYNDKHI
ncbi:acyltransferase family protein [Alkalihalobacillus sp. MEB130]|uniref:acyltransferase family protein n=1 Tax=Alkalihalobacillus sp. MEB130 TaxID=2976704 RepID=UPI0028DF6EBD|nr:acyltransferase family protein [Alkalihalobacillus sp. MEB130]MDT8859907.1 acyltransferase family protein [Alkalihalobacillus sp. MEB130]